MRVHWAVAIVMGLGWGGLPRITAQELDYPSDVFNGDCVNVMDYVSAGVDNTGATDSSAGIQAAIDALANGDTPRQKTLYFPAGTYLITKTIDAKTSAGVVLYRFHIVGESEAGVTIRLGKTSPNFQVSAGVPMIKTENLNVGGTAFDNCVWNLTLDVGLSNPYAIGIDYTANNTGSVRNVTIRASSGSGSGLVGLQMIHAYPGPCMIQNVEIDGFATGVAVGQAEYGATFEGLTLNDQTTAGLTTGANGVFIRRMTSTNVNAVPAIKNGANGLLVLVDSTATYTGSGTAANAVTNTAGATGVGSIFARNFTSSGYTSAILNPQITGGANTSPSADDGLVSEYSSHPVRTPGLAGSRTISLNLPVQDTPQFVDNDFDNWYSVATQSVFPNGAAAVDQSLGIQKAIDAAVQAGKTTLYFPPGKYYLNHPIKIYGSIRRILGFGTYLMPSGSSTGDFSSANAANPQPVIVVGDITGVADLDGDLEMDQINIYPTSVRGAAYFVGIQQNTTKTLTLRDLQISSGSAAEIAYTGVPGVGKLFLDDVEGGNWLFTNPGQQIWARQFDVEGDTLGIPSAYQAKITNAGAALWILGLKTEDYGTLVASTDGASTEVLGCFAWAVHAVGPTHPQSILNDNLFDVEDSDFSVSYVTNGGPDYPNQIGETEGTSDGTLFNAGSTAGTSTAYLRNPTGTVSSVVPLAVAAFRGPIDIPGLDIGTVGTAGGASLSGSVYTVQGAGTNVGGTADSFHLCAESLTGDCVVTARVASLPSPGTGTKAGVMIRESAAPGSAMVMCAVLHNQVDFIIRSATGANAVVALESGLAAPYWVRLQRSGNEFTAYCSPDAVEWTQIGLTHTFTMAPTTLIGMGVTSGSATTLDTATFDNVTIGSP